MSARHLDLASKPFLNSRAVVRLAITLWVLGAALAIANVSLYLRSFSGLDRTAERLGEVDRQISALDERVRTTTSRLRSMDLEQQNARASFLNVRIAERAFGWGQLFDRLAQVLPREVRLNTLAPQLLGGTAERGGRRQTPRERSESSPERVMLRITGAVEGEEPLLELIDRLFADPAFESPSLGSESREEGSLRSFSLSVVYLPRQAEASEAPAFGDQLDDEQARIADREAGESTDESAPTGEALPFPIAPRSAQDQGTVRDRTGEGRYYGRDDPRADSGDRNAAAREPTSRPGGSREAATRQSARDARRTPIRPRSTEAPGVAGVAGRGGLRELQPADAEQARGGQPIPLESPASGTGGRP